MCVCAGVCVVVFVSGRVYGVCVSWDFEYEWFCWCVCE
jgi:hypothetical protein